MRKPHLLIFSILLLALGIFIDSGLYCTYVHDFSIFFLPYYLYFILPGVILALIYFKKFSPTLHSLAIVLTWVLVVGVIPVYFLASTDIKARLVKDITKYPLILEELKQDNINLEGCFPETTPGNTLKSKMLYDRGYFSSGVDFSLELTYSNDEFEKEIDKLNKKYEYKKLRESETINDSTPIYLVEYQVFDNKNNSGLEEKSWVAINKNDKTIKFIYINWR